MRTPAYSILLDSATRLIVLDESEEHATPTITNAAQELLDELSAKGLLRKRVSYVDTTGTMDDIVHQDGRFVRFAPGGGL